MQDKMDEKMETVQQPPSAECCPLSTGNTDSGWNREELGRWGGCGTEERKGHSKHENITGGWEAARKSGSQG